MVWSTCIIEEISVVGFSPDCTGSLIWDIFSCSFLRVALISQRHHPGRCLYSYLSGHDPSHGIGPCRTPTRPEFEPSAVPLGSKLVRWYSQVPMAAKQSSLRAPPARHHTTTSPASCSLTASLKPCMYDGMTGKWFLSLSIYWTMDR